MLRLRGSVRLFQARHSSLLHSLQNTLDPSEVTKLLTKPLSDEERQDLHAILRSGPPGDVANEILRLGLPHDFSLYFTLAKSDVPHKWSEPALLSLVESNPGRVLSLADLVKKHSAGPAGVAVRQAVLHKLLNGENVEVRDGDFELTDEKVRHVIGLLNGFSSLPEVEGHLDSVFAYLAQNNAVAGLAAVQLEGLAQWLNGKLGTISNKAVYLQVSNLVFRTDPLLLRKESLSKVLAYSAEVEHEKGKSESFLAELGIDSEQAHNLLVRLGDDVLAYVEENHLDTDKRDPEAIFLRMQLMSTYGIDRNSLYAAVEKFHVYQTHEKFGIELVQTKLVQAFCYQAFQHLDETLFKVAETLIVPDQTPVSSVAQLILASSQFDGERSLQIYNGYIGQVSREPNSETGRSASGKLTEAMMVASLYENDREFALLLLDKAIANKIVAELEVPVLRNVFKVYGDAYVDDSWETAKPRLLQHVLDMIKRG